MNEHRLFLTLELLFFGFWALYVSGVECTRKWYVGSYPILIGMGLTALISVAFVASVRNGEDVWRFRWRHSKSQLKDWASADPTKDWRRLAWIIFCAVLAVEVALHLGWLPGAECHEAH